MKMKKFMSFLIAFVLCFGNLVFAEETVSSQRYARFAWDGTSSENMNVGYLEGSMLTVTKEKTKMVQLRGGGSSYVGLNLSDSVFKPTAPTMSVAVTVRYYDESEGAYFTIDYTNPSSSRVAAEKVAMTGGGEFKEHTFYIVGDDIHFAVANKREPDEKLNPMMRTQVQFHVGTRINDQEELMRMVADAGMSGTREYGQWTANNAYARSRIIS